MAFREMNVINILRNFNGVRNYSQIKAPTAAISMTKVKADKYDSDSKREQNRQGFFIYLVFINLIVLNFLVVFR